MVNVLPGNGLFMFGRRSVMNIAVLFTGGTIGSTLAGDVIGTKTGAADGLLDTLPCVERDGHVEELPIRYIIRIHFSVKIVPD